MPLPTVKIIECPRDAIQGLAAIIPTDQKASYIQQLLRVGFDTIDMGSFVSPKAIPQMADTGDVLDKLDYDSEMAKLLVIIANLRGAKDAVNYDKVHYLGFPFSISETFQIRNTNATREEAFERIREIQELAHRHDKQLVIYFSMCFGNPYDDLWHPDIVTYWAERFQQIGASTIALSDTTGVGSPERIDTVIRSMKDNFDQMEFGIHLHTRADTWHQKIEVAYRAGCLRYDGAIRGFGGCPMAQDHLIGNMPTENLIDYFGNLGVMDINVEAFLEARRLSFELMKED